MIDEVFAMMERRTPRWGRSCATPTCRSASSSPTSTSWSTSAPREGGEDGNLHWEWSDDVDWEPRVRMAMSSETANKYFQGKENVAVAIARRRIKSGGDVKAALSLIPITKPVYARYREIVEREYPHLAGLTVPAPRWPMDSDRRGDASRPWVRPRQ